ncbi:hypothetical protein [Mucilaginibacter koreensis]
MKTICSLLFAMLLSATLYAQRPVTFGTIPGYIGNCANRYYLSSADKNRGQIIWVDDFNKGALRIGGKTEKLKSLKFPDRLKYGFYNKNYTVSIRIVSQKNTSGNTFTGKATFTVFKGKTIIYNRNTIVAGGCS